MARFVKTRLHWISATLVLLGLYALAGLGYALWVHGESSITFWCVLAVAAFAASIAHQAWIEKKRRRTP